MFIMFVTKGQCADETHSTCNSHIEEVLNRYIDSVNNCLVSNKLTSNTIKFKTVIGSRRRLNTSSIPPHPTLGDVSVDHVSTAKYMCIDVFIDENLSWNSHIEYFIKKIASGIGALKRVRSFAPGEAHLLIFTALVRPYFDYSSVAQGDCSPKTALLEF